MQLSRRDMFKIGGLAAVTAAGLAIPLGNTVSGATASLLPASKMPKPFQTTFSRLEVLPPVKTEVDEHGTGRVLRHHRQDGRGRASFPG